MTVVDLSQTLKTGMRVYPGDPSVKIVQVHNLNREGWRLKNLSMGSHTGTHVDAFSHMDKNGNTLDKIPPDKFFGPAVFLKSTDKLPNNKGLIFGKDRLRIEDFNKIISAKPLFLGISINCDFPVPLERKLLQFGVIIFGNLVNVEKLPKKKIFMFYGLPLKIKDGDGSPIRAVAIY